MRMTQPLLPVFVVASVVAALAAGEPDVSHLINSIDNLNSANEESVSFSFEMSSEFHDKVPAKFRVCWCPPNRYSVLISDSESDCPIALVTNDGFLIVDVIEDLLLFGQGVWPKLSFSIDDDRFALKCPFMAGGTPDPEFSIDLLGLLKGIAFDTNLESSDDSAVLSHASPSRLTNVLWTFARGPKVTLTSVRVVPSVGGPPIFAIDNLRYGDDAELTVLPPLKNTGCRVRRLDISNKHQALEFVNQAIRAITASAAIGRPQYRNRETLGNSVDWTAAEKNARQFSCVLRRQFEPISVSDEQEPHAR